MVAKGVVSMGCRGALVLAGVAGYLAADPASAVAEGAAATSTSASTTAPASEGAAHGLSWNMLAGGVPDSGALAQLELGFSGLPRLAYHQSLGGGLSIGGLVGFDYADYATKAAFSPALVLAVPIRLAIPLSKDFIIGLRADPGLAFRHLRTSGTFQLGVLLNVEADVGFTVQNQYVVGGGISMPVSLTFGSDVTGLNWPILAGPIFEYHVTPPLALTLDAKFGAYLSTIPGLNDFGMRVMGGVVYRL